MKLKFGSFSRKEVLSSPIPMFSWLAQKSIIDTDEKKIDALFERSVVDVLPTPEGLKKVLLSGRRLKIYIGADPTNTALHLSHAKNYMLLEEFRALGHEVVVLFGDFTALIGDPTDKSDTRKVLSKEEINKNVEGWIKQISPIINFKDLKNPAKILYNRKWLSKLSFEEVINLASNTTVQHMLERDMFEKRIKEGRPVFLHEFLYPLAQGYDSVAMDVDIELCGTDQTFNALVGRTLQKRINDREKFVVVVNLMENPKTGELMSKSAGTGVFLDLRPKDMYGAIMAQPDEMVEIILKNNTRISLSEIEKVLELGPRDAKMKTAFLVVEIFHGFTNATAAQEDFVATFQQSIVPKDAKKVKAGIGELLSEVLIREKIIDSKTEFKRLIEAGAITNKTEAEKITDGDAPARPGVYKIGKHRFLEIKQ